MKKFFQDIKADIKFKSAGPGQKLTDSAGCVTTAGQWKQLIDKGPWSAGGVPETPPSDAQGSL